MAYSLPTFNLACNVWHNGGAIPPTGGPDEALLPCQLRYPGKGVGEIIPNPGSWQSGWKLLVPKGSDIRDPYNASGRDTVECPAGSNRYYITVTVDDVGRGFANEYRMAFLMKAGTWPTPIP